MNENSEAISSVDLAQSRLVQFLEELARQGLSQTQVAAQAGIPAQYISDVKCGRRPMTELVARRLGERFGTDYTWLQGVADSATPVRTQIHTSQTSGTTILLPVFPHPIEGIPREHSDWDGGVLEVTGAAAAKAAMATSPYGLRFGSDDEIGRLRKGAFVLVTQEIDHTAEISIVRHRKKLFLARKVKGCWTRVANGSPLPNDCPIAGYCKGIVWGSLL